MSATRCSILHHITGIPSNPIHLVHGAMYIHLRYIRVLLSVQKESFHLTLLYMNKEMETQKNYHDEFLILLFGATPRR